jgi:hypothetical protein
VDQALHCAQEASSTGPLFSGQLVGTPNSLIQFSLAGDALVLAEADMKPNRIAAKVAFFRTVNHLSLLLNTKGLLHRGVITTGDVKCLVFEGSSIITGKGVVYAAQLESSLKTAGLFYDESWVQFIQSRAAQISKDSFFAPFSSLPNWPSSTHAPGLAGVCFSQFDGWDHWESVVNNGQKTNNKVVNALALIQELRTTHGSLP